MNLPEFLKNHPDRMDQDHEQMIIEKAYDIIKWIDENVPRSKKHSQVTMSVKVLTTALIVIADKFLDEKDEENFIRNIAITFKANFDAKREDKRRSKE